MLFPPSLGEALSARVVAERLRTTARNVNRLGKNGGLPAPIVVGPKSRRWSRLAIVEHLSRRSEGGGS